jgi:hypothetical protein
VSKTAAVKVLRREPLEQELGTVIAVSALRVRAAGVDRDAKVATSCLVAPVLGDRVLIVRSGRETYVLAVLDRDQESELKLVFDGSVSLEVPAGRLRVFAQEGVEMASPAALDVRVGDVTAEAKQLQLTFSLLSVIGETLLAKSSQVRLVAGAVDTVAGRIYQRAVHFLRRTDEMDRVEAKSIHRRAEQLVHVHGQNAVTTAEELVKIDGSQVHVG